MMHQYNDIALSIVSDLNTRLLNMSFSKLAENDTSIVPVNEYTPKIWENKWFNDDTIPGYSKGDSVWKYIMTSSDFLDAYHELIYKYASENELLNGYFRHASSECSSEVERYMNVISGYSEDELVLDEHGDPKPKHDVDGKFTGFETEKIQKLPILFDYGAYDSNNDRSIEIYVSLINDNKELLSNSHAWANIVLSSKQSFKEYISEELRLMFDEHINNYHLGGIKTNEEFSDILLKRDFSNFEVSALYNAQQMVSHTQYINDQGFDYVREFKRKIVNTNLNGNGDMKLFKWCRLWNSGHLEHCGIVEIPKYNVTSSNDPSYYTICVDLTWPGSDKLYYDYPISSGFYGSTINNLYFTNNAEVSSYDLSSHVKYNNRYVVSLSPVQFNDDDLSTYQTLKSEDDLITSCYPSHPNNDKNKTFVNYEVHGMTNKSFLITRSRTDDLKDNNSIRYIQYYVSGYRATIDLSYNILSCMIEGLADTYAYTGSQITPTSFRVIASNGDVLNPGIDYTVQYGENIDIGDETGKIEITGINPFYGTLGLTFNIKYDISNSILTGIPIDIPFAL